MRDEMTGCHRFDVHRLDADWDFVACEHLLSDGLPMDRKVVYRK
jgi:hypothetical protein